MNQTESVRYIRFVLFVALSSACLVAASIAYGGGAHLHFASLIFFSVCALALGSTIVPLKHGRLSLLAIPLFTSAIFLSPVEVAVVSLVGNARRATAHRSSAARLGTVVGSIFWGSVGASVHGVAIAMHSSAEVAAVAAVITCMVVNLITATLYLSFRDGISAAPVLRRTLDRTFVLAYLYFGVGALLAASLLDGNAAGWLRVAALFALSVTLAHAVAEHEVGNSLRQQLMVFDERIAFGQEAEAALHAVKNQLLLSSMYIEEISADRLTPEDRDALHIVFESLQQSTDVLRRTSASGRAANAPVYADAELVELTRAVVVLGEARAAQRGVRIRLAAKDKRVPVFADGLLIREVLTNLVQNSLEVLDAGGHIDVTVGIRPDGSPFVEVADDGPGLAPEQVATLFASRTSTKHGSGAGIGLTLSHAIATQHGGRLTYVSGKRRGATFRLVLPARDVARALLAGGRHPQLVVTPAAPGS